MKETFKDIEIGGRNFRINKFDALTGSYIMYTLLTQILPMGLGKKIEGLADVAPEGSGVSIPAMSKETFTGLQKDCLQACSEVRSVGGVFLPVQVLMKDGRWGVEDLENDAPMAMMLTIQALGYNAQSFFEGNVLETFKNSFTQLNSPNA
jgi:hypothetical protein